MIFNQKEEGDGVGVVKKQIQRIKYISQFLAKPLWNYWGNTTYQRTVSYTRKLKKAAIEQHTILYEYFHGKNIGDNPYALFLYLVNHPDFKHYTHVWVVESLNHRSVEHLKAYRNVRVVVLHSKRYLHYLTSAQYLINNTTFPPYFQKKQGQIYINTWHGTPLKTLGKHMKGPLGQHKNIQRNFFQADYLLQPNQYTADKIVQSHDLEGLYEGLIVNEGYPRMDLLLHSTFTKEELQRTIPIDLTKKIVLYAPTWRGNVNDVASTMDDIIASLRAMQNSMPSDQQLIFKVHTLLYKQLQDDDRLRQVCVPDWIDTNELLAVVDVLITDYSSLLFDFLATGRPLLFYVYDYLEYEATRGLYLKMKEMPGPLCYTPSEVLSHLHDLESVQRHYQARYREVQATFSALDDGEATKRNVEIIFGGKRTDNCYTVNNDGKTNILMYCGGFLNNGITTSAINLLNNIDYARYNVAVVDKGSYDAVSDANFRKLHPNVKTFYRVGAMNTTLLESYGHEYVVRKGLINKRGKRMLQPALYERERARLFGDTHFDVVIDFSGYVPFWTLVFAFFPSHHKAIYQHNDMGAEYEKVIKGKRKHVKSLNIIFPLYHYFHNVASVAEHTRNRNVQNLACFLRKEQAVYVHNAINPQKLLEQKSNGEVYLHSNERYLLTQYEAEQGTLHLEGVTLPHKEHINFVTMGRLSPEKDQKKLLLAFNEIVKAYEHARLYIIGEGVLEKELKSLVRQLNLQSHVIFTGQLANPFLLMSHCDCFVLSSNHEGQPMVLLEALVLGLPIIATDIAGSRSILQEGYGTLVTNDIHGLQDGMRQFIEHPLTQKPFHYHVYNEKAMKMFYRTICGVSQPKELEQQKQTLAYQR
ncbi:putative glycosyltransferase [Fictibacillus macauensis ZFHKF-1]|uniref:Putative glycosyltransferase n=1 Tax=Fictibacillus macauensis ZFHKF-1 TaxID=1196324 RepID=I8UHH9_9BACL|nr:glycosyltransferase [Fictibacillus macauensis]EIT86278.1 putative glycosyltransferase [Fictibacillus macauensis ZFHKF-1]